MPADVDALRFGAYLPAYVPSGEPAPSAAFLQEFARHAEDLGFDSLSRTMPSPACMGPPAIALPSAPQRVASNRPRMICRRIRSSPSAPR